MSDEKLLKHYGNTWTGFKSEDGKHYKTVHSDFTDVIERKNLIADAQARSKSGYEHVASIPLPILEAWLIEHNFTMHEFSINAGGDKNKTDITKSGVKDQFLKYFMSRDFSKLHNKHVTTKQDRGFSAGGIYLGDK